MKLQELQQIKPEQEKSAKEILEIFNKYMLGTKKGKLFFVTSILEKVKWLFIMPIEILEQLIAGVEIMDTSDEADKKAKDEIVALLRAFVPVKQLLDEQWKDLEVSL